MRTRLPVLLAAVVALAAACGSSGLPQVSATKAPTVVPVGASVVHPQAATATNQTTCSDGQPVTASVPPLGAVPPATALPAGSDEAAIRARGYLRAGVDQNTYLFGYRDPSTGQLEGFDIDMIKQVATAIFGAAAVNGPNPPIRYVVVPNQNRVQAVQSGQVDIVAETMTITCDRKADVNFSAVYFNASQGVLVTNGSSIRTEADLAGKRVCATTGSTSLTTLAGLHPTPTLVQVANQTDCLVMLQQDQVDAISTDNTILDGLAAQDPNLSVLPNVNLTTEPYGMALPKDHPEFTSFVNAVLAAEEADGTWAAIYTHWLGSVSGGKSPAPPAPTYAP